MTPCPPLHPGLFPYMPPYPPDVNCADVTGPIRGTGSDPHSLDCVTCE